jgi:RNA polymerase sigma-70 factor (ECF subfamily)
LDLSGLDDAALIVLIARSNSGALSLLYDRYGRMVFSVAYHVVGDSETAEEITQDVFVRVWEGAVSYRPELAKVSSWMISITRYRAIDELRRRSVRPEKNQVPWLEETEDGIPLMDGAESVAETNLQLHSVRNAIAALPSDQRKVLSMAFFNGYSHSEISERLGEPLGTVKSRIRLAMQKLRQVFIEQGVLE